MKSWFPCSLCWLYNGEYVKEKKKKVGQGLESQITKEEAEQKQTSVGLLVKTKEKRQKHDTKTMLQQANQQAHVAQITSSLLYNQHSVPETSLEMKHQGNPCSRRTVEADS